MATNSVKPNNGEIKVKKSLKDIKSLDEFNFEELDLIRGDTPDGIKERCLQLCKDYVSGRWSQQTLDSIAFRRVSGGMTNQLYYCGLSTDGDTDDNEPKEVAIRMYGPKWFNNRDNEGNPLKNERLTDVIIALMVSENKLGPKLYGIFEGGQIQHFYEHRQFRVAEQNTPELSKQLFEKLARVHAMDVPIKKQNQWLFDFYDHFYTKAMNEFPLTDMIEATNAETFRAHDLKTELDWIKQTILDFKSPYVFCHNDFRGSNIMVTQNNNNNAKDEILLCDYEYSCYGYRGFDLGTIFCEWGRSMNDYMKVNDLPDDQTIKSLLKHYVDESVRLNGQEFSKLAINSMDRLLAEVKLFTLAGTLFFVVFGIQDNSKEEGFPMDPKIMMTFAEISYKNYWHFKKQFMAQNLFN